MKQKTRIILYILIGVLIVVIGSILIINNAKEKSVNIAIKKINLGNTYLIDLSYDKAQLEFNEAIDVDPNNEEAYLGLARTYIDLGEEEKAVAVLEEGYEKTSGKRLKDKLDELTAAKNSAEALSLTSATTVALPEETTVTTVSEEIVTSVPIEETTTVESVSQTIITTVASTAETTAPPETTVITEAPKKIDPDYMHTVPDAESVVIASGTFNKNFVGGKFKYTIPKTGYYGFIAMSDNEDSELNLQFQSKSGFTWGRGDNCGGEYPQGSEINCSIREEGLRTHEELTHNYTVTMFMPVDVQEIEGSFQGNMFYDGQAHEFYFTPKVTDTYNFEFECWDKYMGMTFTCKKYRADYNVEKISFHGYETCKIKLEAGQKYVFHLLNSDERGGSYTVKIT